MQRIAITGASGFIGRHVAGYLREAGFAGELRLFDRAFDFATDDACVVVDLAAPDAAAQVVEGTDCVIHLAAMPGRAADADPAGSRAINLDFPVSLLEELGGRRVVLASSIAVFGGPLPDRVDDNTVPVPHSVYGTHKRMVELAFADAVRRGIARGCCLRLPGIVARPTGGAGFGSAFLSEIFHAARAGQPYTVPVGPDAVSWLMSARVCAQNLVHGALGDFTCGEALTLPCEVVRIDDLIDELARADCAADFTHDENPALRAAFGSYPELIATKALVHGFKPDNGLAALIANVPADA